MRTGIATIPLDYGRCPRWLFTRMKRLSRSIVLGIVEEFGAEEFLKRLSDPVWFQSLSAVIGMDWNSSGTTTITMGAIKSGILNIQSQLGLYICGGKRNSRKTPEEIEKYGILYNLPFYPKLIYASKTAAKVDSALLQDKFQIYHHNLIFTKAGRWAVVQQGMNTEIQKARRYHWFSSAVKDFVEEPHSSIISNVKMRALNLVAKKSRANKKISIELVKEEPKTFLKDILLISQKPNSLISQKRIPGFTEMELSNVEFPHHPVLREKFDLKRLKKTIEQASFLKPQSFEELISIKGIGPKTVRALSLVSEIVYGAEPSYEDPTRYSFSVGGKDGTPYPIDKKTYDRTLEIMERGIKKSKLPIREKTEAQRRLKSLNF